MRISLHSSSGTKLSALSWEGQSGLPLSGAEFLLIHGLASNAETWRLVGDRLAAEGGRVIALDQRSHGLSQPTDFGFDFGTISADLASVVEQTGLSKPVVAGQSWGGNVAVHFASLYPYLTGSVVGVDGGHIRLQDRFTTWNECKAALTPPSLAGTEAALMRQRMEEFHPDWSSAAIDATMENFRVESGLIYPRLELKHHLQILAAMYEHDPRKALANTLLPSALLILAGEHDSFANPGFNRVVHIDGDHDLHLQHPEQIAKLIAEMAP